MFVSRSDDSIRSRRMKNRIFMLTNLFIQLTGRFSLAVADVALVTVEVFNARKASRQRPLLLLPLRFCVSGSLSTAVFIDGEGDLSKSC